MNNPTLALVAKLLSKCVKFLTLNEKSLLLSYTLEIKLLLEMDKSISRYVACLVD